jgi:hypothetical protein
MRSASELRSRKAPGRLPDALTRPRGVTGITTASGNGAFAA